MCLNSFDDGGMILSSDNFRHYQNADVVGWYDEPKAPHQFWNRIPESVRDRVVLLALTYPEKLPRQLAWHMGHSDVEDTLKIAVECTHVQNIKVKHRPRLLSGNGLAYLSKELAAFMDDHKMRHIHGAPFHPQTQGKIERWHRSLKNVVNLDVFYFPWELEAAIAHFVEDYNHRRYHEPLNNLTPANVFFGRAAARLIVSLALIEVSEAHAPGMVVSNSRRSRQAHWHSQ
jgi:putative transposase